MIKLYRFIKNSISFARRLAAEEGQQEKEGYKIKFEQNGPERTITYMEGDRRVTIEVNFSMLNDVVLYKNSFRKWDIPKEEELTSFDYQLVLNRLIRYFSCWGEVTLFDALPRQNDVRDSLVRDGIPFEELEGGVIRYTSTVEKETIRKGGLFNKD